MQPQVMQIEQFRFHVIKKVNVGGAPYLEFSEVKKNGETEKWQVYPKYLKIMWDTEYSTMMPRVFLTTKDLAVYELLFPHEMFDIFIKVEPDESGDEVELVSTSDTFSFVLNGKRIDALKALCFFCASSERGETEIHLIPTLII